MIKRITLLLFLFLFLCTVFSFGDTSKFIILKEVAPKDGSIYIATLESGLLVSYDDGQSWIDLNNGLPEKKVYPFTKVEYRPVTSIYVDPADHKHLAVTVSEGVYLSENGGKDWEKIPLSGVVKKSNYITSVTLSSTDRSRIIIGTSFNGLFDSVDRGKTWRKLPVNIKPLYRGAHFYEEVTALALSRDDSSLYIACGFENSLYVSLNRNIPVPIPLPDLYGGTILSLGYDDGLTLYTSKGIFRLSEEKWYSFPLPIPIVNDTEEYERIRRQKSAKEKKGIYVNSFHASGAALDSLIDVVKSNGFNSIVVDMKDDEGRITYNTALKLPREAGAIRARFDLKELIKKCRDNEIYLIGRIVTFKDPVLYRYNNGAFAIWDRSTDSTWGNLVKRTDEETGEEKLIQTEFWVDPFSSFIWNYNIAIARELQTFGVDEIQFDYIRFPSDGDMTKAKFRYRLSGMSRIDALESFIKKAREELYIPISTDIYGFNSWYRMGNWIGQDIELLSRYVDVISPMFYPSHFPGSFKPDQDYIRWAQMLYRTGTRRALKIIKGRALIRPYVQAFLIGKELDMEKDEYTLYLDSELKGAREGGASGFTLWNNSNRYYMLDKFSQ